MQLPVPLSLAMPGNRSRLTRAVARVMSAVLVAAMLSSCGGTQPIPDATRSSGAAASENVDSLGAYRREVRIVTPSFHAITPDLRLTYSSRGGNGLVGVGWTLAGFPEIVRTSSQRGVPRYDTNDVFHLDGNELVRCLPGSAAPSCKYARPGEVGYAARSADYRRIAFDPADGPDGGWLVWDKVGTVQTFQARPHDPARPPYAWNLTSVQDTVGNTVTFNRTQATDTASYPASIAYGPVVITLHYEQRPDVVSYGTGKELTAVARRLRSIDVVSNGHRARLYRLTYSTHPVTGRSVLATVEQFGADAEVDPAGEVTNPTSAHSLPVTRFAAEATGGEEWSQSTSTWDGTLPSEQYPPLPTVNGVAFIVGAPHRRFTPSNVGDVDGDGRTDWVQAAPDLVFDPTARHRDLLITTVLPGRPPPLYEQSTLLWPFTGLLRTSYLADMDGDSRADLVFVIINQIAGEDPGNGANHLGFAVALSVGDGTFKWASQTVAATPWETRETTINRVSHCAPGDVDGDRRSDILCSWTDSAGGHHLGTARSRGDGTFEITDEQMPFAEMGETRLMAVGDTNGDGLADAMFLDFPHCPVGQLGCTVQYELVTEVSDGLGGHTTDRLKTSWDRGSPTFFAADINADHKADYVLFQSMEPSSSDPGAIQTAVTTPDGPLSLTSQPVPVALRTVDHSVSVGDADGDGQVDLMVISKQQPGRPGCSSALKGTHANVHRLLSRGNGTFDLPASWESCTGTNELAIAWDDMHYNPVEPTAADLNGDGSDDFLVAVAPAGINATTLWEDLSNGPTGNAFSLRAADVNGDAKSDWVRINNTVTGPYLTTLLSGDNGQRFVGQSPQPGTGQFTVQTGWHVSDVDGDGRDDLVYLRYAGGAGIQIGTWLSQADGSWRYLGSTALGGLSARHRNAAAWRTMDINGDNRGDLVYLDRDDSGALTIWTLVAAGDGTWTGHSYQVTGDWPGPNLNEWRIADVDGDGRHDLVHLAISAGAVTIRSLLSRGDGTWFAGVTAQVGGPELVGLTATNLSSWMVVETNGDGISDFVQITPTDRGGGRSARLHVLTLLGHGDGSFTPRRDEPVGTFTGDMHQWHLSSVTPDGRTDLVHVRVAPPAVTVTSLRPSFDGRWYLTAPTTSVSETTRTSTGGDFAVGDTDGNGQADLVRFDLIPGKIRALTLHAHISRDLIRRVELGSGGTEDVEYGAVAGGGPPACQVPVGVSLLTVSAIVQSAGSGLGKSEIVHGYSCPKWSSRLRGLIGWQEITTSQGTTRSSPTAVTRQRYDVTDACRARPAYREQADGKGAVMDKEIIAYQPPGASAPYNCLRIYVDRITFGRSASLNAYTYFTYDEFGNVTDVVDLGGNLDPAGKRRISTIVYRPAIGPYMVGLPHQLSISEGSPGATRVLRISYYCYDGDNGTDQTSCAGTLSHGLLTATKVVNANGWYDTTNYTYTPNGNVKTLRDADLRTTTVEYDPATDLFPWRVCNALSQCVTHEWDTTTERVTAVVDANNLRTTYHYDVHGRLDQLIPAGEGPVKVEYLDWGVPDRQRIRTTSPDGTADGLWRESYFDGLARPRLETAEGPVADRTRILEIGYDDAGPFPARQSHWHFESDKVVFEEFTFDAVWRLIGQRHPDGATMNWTYDATALRTRTEYTDESAHLGVREADGYKLPALSAAYPSSQVNAANGFRYDVVGDLLQVTDPIQAATARTTDERGDVVGVSDPDRGNMSTEYDRTGHVRKQVDALGQWTRFTYDTIGRRSTMELPSGRIITNLYDEPGHGPAIGQITAVADSYAIGCPFRSGVAGGWIVDERRYDLSGRLSSRVLCVEGEVKTFGFEYDGMGRLAAMTYPDNERVIYQYDDAGQLREISGYATGMVYDAGGRLTDLSLANGLSESFRYDQEREWLLEHVITKGAQQVYGMAYTYYANGQLRSETPTAVPADVRGYQYDGANRLTDVTGPVSQHFSYDAAGDLTENSAIGTYSYVHPDPARNQCGTSPAISCPHAVKKAGQFDLTYDGRGNVTSITRTLQGQNDRREIAWNKDNQASDFSSSNGGHVSVRYDANARRSSVTNGTVTTRYFGGYLEVQHDQGTTRDTKSYYAGNVVLAQRSVAGVTWDHHDLVGSTTLVTDDKGSGIANYRYSAYGTPEGTSGTAGDQRFAGHRPAEFGMIDMGSRYYSPELGRFLAPDSQDPGATGVPSDPYAYAAGDPVNDVDPEGHTPTHSSAFGALGSGGIPGIRTTQDSSLGLGALLTGRNTSQSPAGAGVGFDVSRSNAGGTCSLCHVPRFVPHTPTTREMLEATIPSLAVISPVVIVGAAVAGPEILAAVGVASLEFGVEFPAFTAFAMAVLRGLTGSPEPTPRMRLDYEIWEGSELIRQGTMWSGPGGSMGHAEVKFVQQFMGELGPEHDVLLNGAYNMCGHGECRSMLNSMSIMDGPNIFYFGHSFENSMMLQQFISGQGIAYSWSP